MGPKIFWVKKKFGPKKLLVIEILGSKKILGEKLKKIWDQKDLDPKDFSVQKIQVQKFRYKKNFGLKMFGSKQMLCTILFGPTNFGSKIILGQSLVKIRLVLADIYHYNETRRNVAGTNVAWSNVPMTSSN